MADDDIAKKIAQAEFHLDKLRTPESQLAAESYFAAFIAAARSAVMYMHVWLVAADTSPDDAEVKKVRAWQRINAWEEKKLPAEDHRAWRAVVKLRNADIHDGPVVPESTWLDDPYWGGHFPPGFWGPMYGARAAHVVEHPTTGQDAEVIKLAEATLRVVKRLLVEYKTL